MGMADAATESLGQSEPMGNRATPIFLYPSSIVTHPGLGPAEAGLLDELPLTMASFTGDRGGEKEILLTIYIQGNSRRVAGAGERDLTWHLRPTAERDVGLSTPNPTGIDVHLQQIIWYILLKLVQHSAFGHLG